jgi:hypothetical protein
MDKGKGYNVMYVAKLKDGPKRVQKTLNDSGKGC